MASPHSKFSATQLTADKINDILENSPEVLTGLHTFLLEVGEYWLVKGSIQTLASSKSRKEIIFMVILWIYKETTTPVFTKDISTDDKSLKPQ